MAKEVATAGSAAASEGNPSTASVSISPLGTGACAAATAEVAAKGKEAASSAGTSLAPRRTTFRFRLSAAFNTRTTPSVLRPSIVTGGRKSPDPGAAYTTRDSEVK